jgi:glycyl-tRNA synthetase beta chain
MPELIFELGCEEIPADDLFVLPDAVKRIAAELFTSNRLVWANLETEATPRRLTLRTELEAQQQDLREQKMGPPRKVALDPAGQPTAAGLGFAKNAGVPFKKLKFVSTPKGEYVSAEILIRGKNTVSVLKDLLPQLVRQLPFHKYMRWDSSDFVFGRPIRSILCLFGSKVIPLQIAGVKSGKYTFGHRFLGKKKLEVTTYEQYCSALLENGVILRFSERQALIQTELEQHASAINGNLKEDQDLLRTMANEVEFPEVLTGNFPPDFLELPQEILMNAMRKHQKYFCSVDSNGQLLPVFHTVLNTKTSNPDLIRKGHERVLMARLRDAEFFWNEDRKTPLQQRSSGLERLTYHEKLGSYAEKVERMKSIAEAVLAQLPDTAFADGLAQLVAVSKVDLSTLMVGEFPELQGIMCGLYARAEGYPEPSWIALYDQYLPVSADDSVPRNMAGSVISLVDRFESMSSGFVLNMIPTGSKDPYALRRIATGAMKIILEKQLHLDLRRILEHSLSLYRVTPKLSAGELLRGVLDLMESRFRFLMEQKGIAHDYLNAILSTENKSYVEAEMKAKALWAIHDSPDLKVLARGFKRINNIISKEPHYSFDAELLEDDGEARLHRAFSDLAFRVRQNIQERQYEDALEIMVTLGPEIDNFFDEVMVMVDQVELRYNRIALLQEINELYRKIADFSALQIEL